MHPDIENRLRTRAEAEGISVDQYVDQLMQHEDAELAQLEALLQEAADSGDYIELDDREWDRIKRDAIADLDSRRRA